MLSAPLLTACELEDEDEEAYELRKLVTQFDQLFERCMTGALTFEERNELNELYSFLQLKEEEIWGRENDWFASTISDRLGMELPALRYQLGMLPDTNIYTQ